MNKKLLLISALLLVASNGWAYNEQDLAKFKALNACEGCDLSGVSFINADLSGVSLTDTDLSGADLRDANLGYANLSYANLYNADLRGADLTGADLEGAKYCKTKMPWGELNDDCED